MTAWKLVVSCSLLVISLFLAPLSALAVSSLPSSSASATTTYNLQPTTSLPPTIPPTSPLYTDLLVNNMFHTFSCLAVGQSVIGQPCLTYQVTKNTQGVIQSVPVLSSVNLSGGTLGAVTSVIGALYMNPPVRTADYLASVGEGLGIVKEVHAQGVTGSGANVLKPIISLWQVSRNISYVIMIIIFVVIGLMIMFRNKINPQTVITAQTALPGLVIGLIMITFSYFLAGLISDMAFVGTNVVGFYFVAAQGKLDDTAFKEQLDLTQKLSGDNILSIMAPLTGIVTRERAENVANSILSKLGDALTPIRIVVFWLTAQFVMPFAGIIPPPFGLLIGPLASLGIGALANIGLPFLLGYFLSFAAALALTYQMIKLLLRLIMAWLTIIFLTISAPFQFLFASLPGRQGIATGWMLNMLGNILIFPAVVAVMYFVVFLLGSEYAPAHCPDKDPNKCPFKVISLNEKTNGDFISPVYAQSGINITSNATFPLFGGLDLGFIKILLAFGALMALPSIPDIIIRNIGKGGQAGQMIGQEIMGGFGQGQGYARRTYMAGVGYGQAAQQSLLGERGMLYNPTTGKYYPGLTKAGFFNYKKELPVEKGGAQTPSAEEGLQ
ncbi:MAG: hypothetical protein PHV63_02535 [Candidatus Daviesbacteria bacterium]|nr:hypothetical protein [Candidatus Daviesbacteria bacterium]